MLRNFCARTCSFCAKQFFEAPGPVGALWNFVKDAADSLHVIEGMATTSMAVVIIVALWAFVCPGKYKFLSVDAGRSFVLWLCACSSVRPGVIQLMQKVLTTTGRLNLGNFCEALLIQAKNGLLYVIIPLLVLSFMFIPAMDYLRTTVSPSCKSMESLLVSILKIYTCDHYLVPALILPAEQPGNWDYIDIAKFFRWTGQTWSATDGLLLLCAGWQCWDWLYCCIKQGSRLIAGWWDLTSLIRNPLEYLTICPHAAVKPSIQALELLMYMYIHDQRCAQESFLRRVNKT